MKMITENMNRAVLYIRYGCVGHNDPSEEQRKLLVQEAASQGMEVAGEYVDACRSGMSSQNRPQLLKLLDDAKSGLFKHLLVFDMSRLSRGPDFQELITELQGAGVTMHFVDNKVVM